MNDPDKRSTDEEVLAEIRRKKAALLHLARQVLDGEFEGASRSQLEDLAEELGCV